MEMMYQIIAKEIKAAQLENAHPTDYLNFYCLGNREECPEEESNGNGHTSSNGNGITVSVPHSDIFCNHNLYATCLYALLLQLDVVSIIYSSNLFVKQH